MDEYLYIELDVNGLILDFECTFMEVSVKSDDYINKNWFDVFIEVSDRKKEEKLLRKIFEGSVNRMFEQKNDIKWFDGTHKYMHFYNELQIENGRKVLKSKAYEKHNSTGREVGTINKQPLP